MKGNINKLHQKQSSIYIFYFFLFAPTVMTGVWCDVQLNVRDNHDVAYNLNFLSVISLSDLLSANQMCKEFSGLRLYPVTCKWKILTKCLLKMPLELL